MTTSLLGVNDPDVKRALRNMTAKIDALEARLAGVISEEGTFIANLGVNATKTTTAGEKTVTAGAITLLDDFDDITDGATYLKVAGVSGSNQVQEASIATGAVTNPKIGALAVDTAELAAGAVTNPKIGALAVDTAELAAGAVTDGKIVAGADIAPSKILISGAINLDDWRDAGDNEKIAGAQLGNLSVATAAIANDAVNTAKIDGDAVTKNELEENAVIGDHFDELVIDEFQSADMGSLQSDGQWDALET